jgi:hypothetical protein
MELIILCIGNDDKCTKSEVKLSNIFKSKYFITFWFAQDFSLQRKNMYCL